MRKDLEERRIQTTVRTKWLQQAEAKGYEDIDSYIESLENTLEKKQQQYEHLLSIRDSLYSTLTEAAGLLKQVNEAIQQQKDLKSFQPQIEEFLQKNKEIIL